MNPCTISPGSLNYKSLEAVAALLTAFSPHNAEYVVRDVYFDFGQRWMWTTICRKGWNECQILNPREWEDIIFSDTMEDLFAAVEKIRNDAYFMDK